MSEGLELIFPGATRTEPQVYRFSASEIKTIESQIDQRLPNVGNRAWLAWNGTNLLGVAFLDHVIGKHELIDYLVGISPTGAVQRIEILEYRESYGGEIRKRKWREQFQGKTKDAPFRLNDDIYNISGATLSSRHVTEGIKRLVVTFDVVVRPRLPALPGSGVSHSE